MGNSLQGKHCLALGTVATAWLLAVSIGPVLGNEVLGNEFPQDRPIDWLLVTSEEGWLLSVATPVASRRRGQEIPLLVAMPATPTEEIVRLLARLAPKRGLVLTLSGAPDREGVPDGSQVSFLETGTNPVQAAIRLARQIWGRSDTVVVAPLKDREAVIMGATLAAHLAVPLLFSEKQRPEDALLIALTELGTNQVILSTSSARKMRTWADQVSQTVSIADQAGITTRLLEKLGPDQIRTVILAGIPHDKGDVGGAAWLAPYLSLVRKAPIVLCGVPDARKAEESVYRLISEHALKPRSVTILADYASIGVQSVSIQSQNTNDEHGNRTQTDGVSGHADETNGYIDSPDYYADEANDYVVEVEPCVYPSAENHAAGLGVGRIPFSFPARTSILIARGLVRERILKRSSPDVLMVANATNGQEGLELCETISRATAAEFANSRFRVHESYKESSDNPAALEAAAKAGLIIYQGHSTEQLLFHNPSAYGTEADMSMIDDDPDLQCESGDSSSAFEETSSRHHGAETPVPVEELSEPGSKTSYFRPLVREQVREVNRPLEGLPLVILQSCSSLQEGVGDRIFDAGGVGLIGSVTSIHSASGSSFVKALCDGILYRGDTIGEALCDARNYFYCLQELKNSRGHTQQIKSLRVALSFRLWGDPELRVFPKEIGKPRRAPASVTWNGHDQLTVSLPGRRLPTFRTEKYFATMFPGSEAAGLVKRLKNKSARRVVPIHFFRVPLPGAFAEQGYARVIRLGDQAENRAAFRIDPLRRYAYVLYFPDEEKPGETFTLQFK